MGARRIALVCSLPVVLVLSLGSLVTRGLNLGLDFTGGDLLELSYAGTADLADIRAALTDDGFGNPLVQNFGTATDVLVRLPPQGDVRWRGDARPGAGDLARARPFCRAAALLNSLGLR